MIYFFYGKDTSSAKRKIRLLTDSLLKKKPDALYLYFDDRNLDNEFIKGLFQSRGLFSENHIIFLDRAFSSLESKDLVKEMKKSSHVFIFLEDSLNKKDFNYLSKYSEKSEKFQARESLEKENRSKVFSLTNALGARDRKKLWFLYRELIDNGLNVEEIQPVLFWQVKTMLMVKNSNNAKETGLKPFVYSNSKKYAGKYNMEELRDLSRNLVKALYGSRQGRDLENEIEKILLTV